MSKDFSFIVEDNLSKIFNAFANHKVKINLMQNSAISFSVCTDYDEHKIEPLLKDLQKQFKVLYNKDVELMTVRNYDQRQDRHFYTAHVLHDDQNIAEGVAQIVSMELLRTS
jgi:aspartate kinase